MIVGGGFLVLGMSELVAHLDEPRSLFFWLPALWGGGVLTLVGVFSRVPRAPLSTVLVGVGVGLGLVASAWTVLMPVLAICLLGLAIAGPGREKPRMP